MYISKNKEICCISPRIRLSVIGGESDITRTVNDNKIRDICERVVKKFDFTGPITLQLIQDKNTLEMFLLEINPRLEEQLLPLLKQVIIFQKYFS